ASVLSVSALMMMLVCLFFFFQAEDGIRYWSVTGVQTCALPISQAVVSDLLRVGMPPPVKIADDGLRVERHAAVRGHQFIAGVFKIGRASCRERVEISGVEGSLEKKSAEHG